MPRCRFTRAPSFFFFFRGDEAAPKSELEYAIHCIYRYTLDCSVIFSGKYTYINIFCAVYDSLLYTAYIMRAALFISRYIDLGNYYFAMADRRMNNSA